jgi:hypothetical protein
MKAQEDERVVTDTIDDLQGTSDEILMSFGFRGFDGMDCI